MNAPTMLNIFFLRNYNVTRAHSTNDFRSPNLEVAMTIFEFTRIEPYFFERKLLSNSMPYASSRSLPIIHDNVKYVRLLIDTSSMGKTYSAYGEKVFTTLEQTSIRHTSSEYLSANRLTGFLFSGVK